jgi:hypothetical protein
LQYGNEPSTRWYYTNAVLLIRIPSFHERDSGIDAPKSFWEGIEDVPLEDYEDDDGIGVNDEEDEKMAEAVDDDQNAEENVVGEEDSTVAHKRQRVE